jgi:hypothetical protein
VYFQSENVQDTKEKFPTKLGSTGGKSQVEKCAAQAEAHCGYEARPKQRAGFPFGRATFPGARRIGAVSGLPDKQEI